MKELTIQNFDAEIQSNNGITIVDFWAAWCGPCRMISPILEEIDREVEDVTVMKVNVDNEPALADRFAINAIPTLIFFKNGELIKQKTGLYPRDALDLIIKEIRG
ncbi:MAG: thioredoxin [Clostridia bacterium]|nr:thioredoxin [Clostridia bacterium]